MKEFEHVFTTTVVIALHKGRISRTFRASAHTTAKTHSPEVLSSIRSQGLGLEHGRIAQRSPSSQKEMSRVLQPLSALLSSAVPALQSSWHHVPLRNSSITRRHPAHVPYTPQGNPLSTPLPPTPRSQDLRHGTSHRRTRGFKPSVSRAGASIISPYDLRRGIDR